MNRLNKIILSFVLPFFCLLISVSYADIVANQSYAANNSETETSIDWNATYVEGYTYDLVSTILANYERDTTNETYINDFNNMISAFENSGKNVVVFKTIYDSRDYACIVTYDSDSNVCFGSPLDRIGFILNDTSQTKTFSLFCNRQYKYYNITCTPERPFPIFNTYQCYEVYYSSTDVYKLTMSGSWLFSWDGESYYYKAETEESPIVEDLQLKKIIDELFTSSTFLSFPDSWRNNFFIIYNKSSNIYEIIVAPDYVYFRGYKYIKNESDFYRMLAGSSPNFDTYDFSNLVNNSYTEYTNPLGSFNLYKFVYECDEEGNVINRYNRTFNNMTSDKTEYLTENQILVYTRRNIPFYTLNTDGSFSEDTTSSLPSTVLKDENGEIIVITPPKQPQDEIINDADFGDLSNSFEEHKGIFSFTENMQWLISANNKLSNYFLGFIVMCALFITLGRVLKG